MGSCQLVFIVLTIKTFAKSLTDFFLLLNMASHKISKPSKKTMEKKSSKIIKKKRSKKNKEGQKKRTAPAALVKVMNVSNDLADIIGMKKALKLFGHTSRRITCKIQLKDNTSHLMPRWPKFSEKPKMKTIHMSKYLSSNLSD